MRYTVTVKHSAITEWHAELLKKQPQVHFYARVPFQTPDAPKRKLRAWVKGWERSGYTDFTSFKGWRKALIAAIRRAPLALKRKPWGKVVKAHVHAWRTYVSEFSVTCETIYLAETARRYEVWLNVSISAEEHELARDKVETTREGMYDFTLRVFLYKDLQMSENA